jgi:cytochrome c
MAVSNTRIMAAGDRALGEYLSSECVTCHQVSGQSSGGIPPIIGLPDDSFIQIMDEYRKKTRNNPIMQTTAGRLSDDEIAALAAYFGSLKGSPPARTNTPRGRRQ